MPSGIIIIPLFRDGHMSSPAWEKVFLHKKTPLRASVLFYSLLIK